MGNPEKVLDVRIVIMPVLTGKETDGKEFYELLQKLRDYKVATKLLKCSSAKEIREILMKAAYNKTKSSIDISN
jgi:mannitol/fructose-specific phosphotransferase system IIA component (Ntr-type)